MKDPKAVLKKRHQSLRETDTDADSRPMIDVICIDDLLKIRHKVQVPSGTTLIEALKQIEFIYGFCGGTGKCGRCIVEIDDGILVQSCYYRVTKNITVRKWRGF